MKLQAGDKVKFLNEKGGGTVKRIIDTATVELSIDEGFDIPVLISNLIKVASASASEKLFDGDYKSQMESGSFEPEQKTSREEVLKSGIAASEQASGVYLAWRPYDQKLLIAGMVDVIIINHTEYDILYNIFRKTSKGFEGLDYGSIGPEASVVIDTCNSNLLEKWMDGVVQFMFHKENCLALISPSEVAFRVKAGKIINEDNYLETSLIRGLCYMIRLYVLALPGEELIQKVVQLKPHAGKGIIEKHRVTAGEGIAEVDLHIHSLVDNTAGLDNYQLMNIQLDYVRRSLESAVKSGFEKVIYIHGVGAGILKIELRKLLESYDFVEFYDASIAKYGIGATEVLIHKTQI